MIDKKKLLMIILVFTVLLVTLTAVVSLLDPKLHKNILLEQIIYKRDVSK